MKQSEWKRRRAQQGAREGEVWMRNQLESLKLDYDTYKHLTTLSTGAIVILCTFLEKLFTDPQWKPLIVVSIVGFLISVVGSVASMFKISASMDSGKDPNDEITKTVAAIAFCALGGFLTGITALAVFAVKNFL